MVTALSSTVSANSAAAIVSSAADQKKTASPVADRTTAQDTVTLSEQGQQMAVQAAQASDGDSDGS